MFILISLISIFSNINCDTDSSFTATPTNWKKIEDVWPTQDIYDSKISEFFFITDIEKDNIEFNLDKKFIDNLKDLNDNQTVKLSFKYWSSAKRHDDPPKPSINFGSINILGIDERYANYKIVDEQLWMPIELVLSKRQLNDFKFVLKIRDKSGMAAIKNLKIEYEEIKDGEGAKDEPKDRPKPPEKKVNHVNFPIDCYTITDKFNGYCANGFAYNLNANNSSGQVFTIDGEYNDCFKIKMFSKVKSEVKAIFNGYGDTTPVKIKTFHPMINTDENIFQTENLCLLDYTTYQSGLFEITFDITFHETFVDNSFSIYLEKLPKHGVQTSPYNFLSEMKKDLENGYKWTGEWKIKDQTNFVANDSGISFSARTFSRNASTATLNSVWMKYKPNHFNKDAQIILTTDNEKDFNSFNLKPKVCTEFFHCIDVFTTKFNDKGNKKTIDFNFDNKLDSEFIKLVFEVGYFIPLYHDKPYFDVKFNLQLINFGDPCSGMDICGKNGICKANPEKPDEKPSCLCINGFTGESCNQKDYCVTSGPNQPAGQTVCDSVPGYPDCKNSGNSFRCVCDDSNINWNPTSKKCEPLTVGKDNSSWNVLDPETFLLYPTKESNFFTLNFTGVDKPEQLCLSISYVSKSNSMLHVSYRGDLAAAETTFDYFLQKSPDKDETVDVCLYHFRYYFEDTFKLRISISDLSAFNEDTFKINLIETNFVEISSIWKIKDNFLNKWDSGKPVSGFTDHWQILPSKINPNFVISNEISSLAVSKNEFVTIRYISSWIKEDPYFGNSNSESYFKIGFGDQDSKKLSQISKKILFHTDEKLTKIMDLTANEIKISDKEFAYKFSNFPKNIYQRFRIIIDITMKTPKDADQTFNVGFTSFSIGDPCFIKLGQDPYCKTSKNKAKTTCQAINGPDPTKEKICTCQDSSGDNCQWDDVCDTDAKSFCESYIVDDLNNCNQINSKEYECSCPSKYFKRDKKKCLIKKKFEKKVIECTGNSCPFMTSLIANFNWASKELPRLYNTAEKDSKLPFYYTNKKDNLITFKFTGKENTDICAKLEYSSTGNSNFSISYNKDNKPIQLPKTLGDKEIYSEQTICISDLAEPIIKDMIFNLKFETNSDLSQVAVVHLDKSAVIVSNNQDSLKLLSPLPYLVQYDSNIKEDKFHQKNQWPLLLPSKNSEWEVVTDSNTIKFTTQYSGIRESFLFSHWLEPNKEHILFRTNISNIDPLNDFEMEFLLYDNKLSATNLVPKIIFNSQRIIDNGVEETVHIPIPPQKTAFRVAIKVTYNVEQQSLFELVGTDIGDPCIIDGNIINTCTDRGTCKRNENGYTCECRTDPDTKLNFTGNNCEIKDFCKTPIAKDEKKLGQDVCNEYKSNCTNVENGFKCVCPDKETYWDVPDKKCLPIPKCFTHKCGDNEICGDDKQGNATCLCEDGYVRNNKTNGGCELYDPCNQLHRLWKNPPEDLNRCVLGGKCVALSKGKHSDWYCVCDPGYKKTGVKDLTTCTSLICDNKWMNKCQQKCEIDNTIKDHPYNCSCFDNYIRDGDNCKFNTSFKKCEKCDTFDKYCDITGNCVCKPEFEEQSDKSCKMKIDESVCPTKNYTKDSSGNQYCDCGKFYDYNKAQSTCDLKPICAKGGRGRDTCDKQNKICTLNPKKEELFECVCPANLKEDKTRDNKCVNNCVFENNFDRCASRNAICNPYRSMTDLCECPPGFEMTKPLSRDSICVVNEFSSRFSLQFKNDYIFSNCKSLYDEKTKPLDLSLFNHDLNGILKDSIEGEKLNRAILELILSEERIECFSEEILKEMIKLIPDNSYKKGSMENKCSKLKSGDLSCTFSVVFTNEKEQKNTNIFNNLRDSCVPFGDNKECFILLDDPVKPYSSLTGSAQTQSKVILYSNSVKDASLTSNKGCGEPTDKQNPCPRFSNCVQDKTNAYYNCTCNKEYFTSLKPVTNLLTATGPNQKYIIEKCQEKDICTQKCTTKNGNNCVQNATQINGGAWKVQYACNCLDPLMRNNVTACTEACSNIECKNGVNNIRGGICHCECNEGYYGESCKLESSTSKGGWIAGIVVLAVLVVILAGVAFMFARRSRNNSTEYSGRPMDDYTGSSYRVPPNQSRGQQNPSFTRE